MCPKMNYLSVQMPCYNDHIDKVSLHCVSWDVESNDVLVQILCHTDHIEKISDHCVFWLFCLN